ncbi:hypothetical protein [Desulfosediminicola flagellatus]|uniref:hypothetical protein n=1 Tax=Desulfosediminicola flagellatus TaxID=2569541 RepID=UPI0010AC4934|nr:hypothetical protein [Desulfosediminicola flagellatus]
MLKNLQINTRLSTEDESDATEKSSIVEQRFEGKGPVTTKLKFKRLMLVGAALLPVMIFLVAAKTFLFEPDVVRHLPVSVAIAGNQNTPVEKENPVIDDRITEEVNPDTTFPKRKISIVD